MELKGYPMDERSSWMRTFDDFEKKTMQAFDLQPQEGEYAFLPGKGWGTEIAIQYPVYKKTANGYVERRKNPACFQERGYRTHSDFELYGMSKEGKHYTPDFAAHFGDPEWFETTKMHDKDDEENITRDELWANTEITVLPNGKKIKTLSVEYLLVEKLIENPHFSAPNNHGRDISDAAALAIVYDDIDREKVKEIYMRNYVGYNVNKLKSKQNLSNEQILGGFATPEDFIMKPFKGTPSASRYEWTIRRFQVTHWPEDELRYFISCHYSDAQLLRDEDYIPLMAINNDPKSWMPGTDKLTEKAKQAIKNAMIKSTQESLTNWSKNIQTQIDAFRLKALQDFNSFFQALDQKKREIENKSRKGKSVKRHKPGSKGLLGIIKSRANQPEVESSQEKASKRIAQNTPVKHGRTPDQHET